MKCPFRTETVHKPELKDGYIRKFAKDIVEYADCYEGQCPYYLGNRKCLKVENEREQK